MADRTISVRLKAEVADFKREMAGASSELDKLVKQSGNSAGAANTALGRMAQSAKLQSSTWQTVGSSLTRVGLAITAVNTAVAVTGVNYNTLQQKSRAALTTILGGAQQANAQMDKLDEFARTSPFSKAVFLDAQQQMLGFGIEAEKVVPYLSAINEAVAATGGSNQDIAELTRIFSQVQAASKITAVDLMQFGQRGVDAATLIGSQMGKTGAQIRDDISSGSLDAQDALDALAAGMQERFEGASAGVKNTMEGAFDRVKAAWRDLSASMLESAVDPEGGGWLVDLTNNAADLLRVVEKLPQPVKDVGFGVGALGGAALLAAGGFISLVPRIAETATAMSDFNRLHPGAAAGLKNVGKAAGAASLALAGFMAAGELRDSLREAAVGVDDVTASLVRAEKAGVLTGDAFRTISGEEIVSGVSSWSDALRRVANDTGNWTTAVDNLDAMLSDLTGSQSGIDRLVEQMSTVDAQLASMESAEAAAVFELIAQEAEAAGRPIGELVELFPKYASAINLATAENGDAELSTEQLVQAMRDGVPVAEDATSATGDLASATRDATASTTPFTDALKAQNEAVRDSLSAFEELASAAIAASDSNIALEDAIDKASTAAEENGATLDINTEKGRDNRSALNGIADAALRVASDMLEAGDSTEDITSKTQRARDKFIDVARQMGLTKAEAKALADEYGLIPKEIKTAITVKADLTGYYNVNRVLNSIDGRTVSAYVAIRQTGQGAVATGGYGQDVADAVGLAGGGQARRRYEGLLNGPGTPTSDSIPAWLSRSEFVTNAAATSYYGTDVMYAMNARRIPRDYFKPLGFADGGSPSVTYSPAPVAAQSVSVSNSLDPSGIEAAVQRGLASARFSIDGRAIDVRIDHAMNRQARNLRRGA